MRIADRGAYERVLEYFFRGTSDGSHRYLGDRVNGTSQTIRWIAEENFSTLRNRQLQKNPSSLTAAAPVALCFCHCRFFCGYTAQVDIVHEIIHR